MLNEGISWIGTWDSSSGVIVSTTLKNVNYDYVLICYNVLYICMTYTYVENFESFFVCLSENGLEKFQTFSLKVVVKFAISA